MNTLKNFVGACPQGSFCRVRDFVAAFRAALPAGERPRWGRGRIIAEMAALGYRMGLDASNAAFFTGIGLPMQVDADGRLTVALADGPLAAAVA
jgi:hypothetical protein